MYREANAWQVSFFAPHDMPGLVQLYGGPGPFEAKLDSLFTVPWNPTYIARNVSGFIGQYCQGNQPDHEAPFAYYFVGKPEKSQRRLDEIMERFYGIGPEGLALSGMGRRGRDVGLVRVQRRRPLPLFPRPTPATWLRCRSSTRCAGSPWPGATP